MARWWLVTWTTYGSWLPGDPRGYRTWRGREHVGPPRRYAAPGETTYRPAEHRLRHETAQQRTDSPVVLTPEQVNITLQAMIAEMADTPVVPAIVAVGDRHVYVLARFDSYPIRMFTGRIKAAATRELNQQGFAGTRPWAKGYSMRSKNNHQELVVAYHNVRRHDQQHCAIHARLQADDLSSSI